MGFARFASVLAFVLFLTGTGFSQNILTEENFPDLRFRQLVIRYFSSASVTAQEAESVTGSITLNRFVTDVSGIEFLTGLEELDCSNASISELNLTGNINLVRLECVDQGITSLDLRNLSQLHYLAISGNALTELDLTQNTRLKTVLCQNNQIATLDLSNLTELERIDCSSNQLAGIDVSNNPNLDTLIINNNSISDISQLVSFEQLKRVDIRNNALGCDDWMDVAALYERLGEAATAEIDGVEYILNGIAFSPQNGIDPFFCDSNIPDLQPVDPQAGEQFPYIVTDPDTGITAMRSLVYLPRDYGADPDKQWPIIFFHHGSGQLSDNLDDLTDEGIPKQIRNGDHFPFIIVSPQQGTPESGEEFSTRTNALLSEQLLNDFAIDSNRMYLTGLSRGGFLTFFIPPTIPNVFAALAPIAGGGNPDDAEILAEIPIWVFHGDQDDAVLISESERMVEAIQDQGGDIRFTVYKGVGHDSWTETYLNPELYEWFLEQQLDAGENTHIDRWEIYQ